MKKVLKRILSSVAPQLAENLHVARHRRHIEQFEKEIGVDRLAEQFVAKHGLTVQAGPFAGLNYIERASGSAFLPKLIGSYEAEIHPAIDSILATKYHAILDVGCAEGYYAVGLASRLRGTPVFAYDIDDTAQARCESLAKLNGVADQITILGRCDAAELNKRMPAHSLLVCDCEGFEQELLDPQAAPSLMHADLLIELHDHLRPGVTTLLQQRFAATHDAKLFDSAPRDPAAYSSLHSLPIADQQLAVSEFRPSGQRWLFLTVNRSAR